MSQKHAWSKRLDDLLWSDHLRDMPAWRRRLVWFGRLLYALGRDLTQGYLSLQAMSLVYTTLLSLVPLLAVSFSVLKGFGAHNELEPLLLQALAPLGERADDITRAIIGFVDNMRVGVLGSVGLLVLVYTVLTLIQKIEQVFNYTWRAEENRPFAQRFSQYLSVLLIGPVLFFSAVGLSASVRSSAFVEAVLGIEPFGSLIEAVSRVIPYLLLAFAFAFIYVFVPNVRVRFRSAMIGALVAALLWQGVGYVFAKFMVGSTQYMAIYSSLAILVLFMIWVYIAWLILLIGASIAFYHQHPEYLASRSRDLALSNRLRERLGLLLAGHITQRYLAGEEAWTADALVEALEVPRTNIARMLRLLERAGFLVRTAHTTPRYLLTQAPEGISVKALLDGIRCYEERYMGCRGTAPDAAIAGVEARLERALDDALAGMTLRDLGASLQAPRPAVQESPADAGHGPSAQVPAVPLPGPPLNL